ncbi:hypothetical protein HYW99_04475 [Candidatus Woesearchaeota archaeon]|nr:hypothetical protein [Candidatus Woesearchaeota archaeon]
MNSIDELVCDRESVYDYIKKMGNGVYNLKLNYDYIKNRTDLQLLVVFGQIIGNILTLKGISIISEPSQESFQVNISKGLSFDISCEAVEYIRCIIQTVKPKSEYL